MFLFKEPTAKDTTEDRLAHLEEITKVNVVRSCEELRRYIKLDRLSYLEEISKINILRTCDEMRRYALKIVLLIFAIKNCILSDSESTKPGSTLSTPMDN